MPLSIFQGVCNFKEYSCSDIPNNPPQVFEPVGTYLKSIEISNGIYNFKGNVLPSQGPLSDNVFKK